MIAAAIGLSLAAAAIHGTWNVLVKVSGDPLATFRRATVVAVVLTALPTAVAWWLAGKPGLSPAAAGWCFLSAIFELIYLWLLSTAYRRGELSVVYPIARGSAPLLAVIAGLGLLGERLATTQLIGIGLLLVGIIAVTLPQTSGRATLPALLTGVAIATYTSIDRIGVRLTTPWLYCWLLTALIGIGLVVSMRVGARFGVGLSQSAQATQPTWNQSALIGILMWGGYLLVLWALSLGPLSVVAPVRETAVVAVAVWGVWRLGEKRGAALKLSGALATLVGVALLAA
ncbi:MAG: EamA family transporter [Candidatus Dormibacterales bacterium]